MFVEWLIEAHYLRLFLGLSHILHFTTLQKITDRINNALLERIISSFIVLLVPIVFVCIESTGFKMAHASQYYTSTGLTRKYTKLSIGVCIPTNHVNMDFKPIVSRTSDILSLSVVAADKHYDSEDNHLFVREYLCVQCNPSPI